jgi:hypothetical protein
MSTGKFLPGEKNPRAKVSDALGRIVHAAPGTYTAISKKYGVSLSTVTAIKQESGRWARLFFDWNSVYRKKPPLDSLQQVTVPSKEDTQS